MEYAVKFNDVHANIHIAHLQLYNIHKMFDKKFFSLYMKMFYIII